MSINLCLGTVQFGMDYGITNKAGKVKRSEVKKILDFASKLGVRYIDTAQAYGDSEMVLGETMTSPKNFKIINKLKINTNSNWDKEDIKIWEFNLQTSFQKLRIKKLDTLLIHKYEELLRADSNILLDWMESLKQRKLVDRIGVSIYDVNNLDVLPLERLDLIQIPLSIYDQRFLRSGAISHLISNKKVIHVRSIFMQGLLLQNSKLWPGFLSEKFKSHHSQFSNQIEQKGISHLEASLEFIRICKGLEAAIFGVTNLFELKSILMAWELSKQERFKMNFDTFENLFWQNQSEVDPRVWPKI